MRSARCAAPTETGSRSPSPASPPASSRPSAPGGPRSQPPARRVALGLPHPLLAALIIGPTLDRAAASPLTPGNIGVASGAVAIALQGRGIGATHALGVGIGIQALEALVSLAAGVAGGFYFLRPTGLAARWAVRVAAVGLSLGAA